MKFQVYRFIRRFIVVRTSLIFRTAVCLILALLIPMPCRADADLIDTAKRHGVIAPPSEIFVAEQNGGTFLVAIGQAELKKEGAQGRLVARTIARTVAQKALTSFIHEVSISSRETFTKEKRRLTIERPGQAPQVVEDRRSKYEESILEKSEGVINSFSEIGDWVGQDGKTLYYCLAVEL